MSFSRIRLLTGALLATVGTFAGNKNAIVPASQHIGIDPLVPKPTPRTKKKTNGISNKQSWWARYMAFRRAWAPAGGGTRECARRRAQIGKGMLGRCNDVHWSDATLAEVIGVVGMDPGSPEGDMTARAHGHGEPDGTFVIDDIEFQPAGRDL